MTPEVRSCKELTGIPKMSRGKVLKTNLFLSLLLDGESQMNCDIGAENLGLFLDRARD
jgi:hypothetical protein